MTHKFVILKNNKLEVYDKYEDIPESFDNLIEFRPDIPPAPHTHDEHDEIETWNNKLKELMKRETK